MNDLRVMRYRSGFSVVLLDPKGPGQSGVIGPLSGSISPDVSLLV